MTKLTVLTVVLGSAVLFAACGDRAETIDDTTGALATQTPPTNVEADDLDDRVEVALSTDSVLRRYGLDADDDDNRIVLTGAVRTGEERAAAAVLASGLAQGLTVENRIEVDADVQGSDDITDVDELEDQIEDAFEADATLNALDIDVGEDDGRIVLSGRVPAAAKTAAESLARGMAGTVEVVSRITVNR